MELNTFNHDRHTQHSARAMTQADQNRKTSKATTTTLAIEAGPHDLAQRAWTWRVVVMTLLVSIGGMIFGYGGIGTIGGFLAMSNYNEQFGVLQPEGHYALGDERTGFIVGFLMIGALVGSLAAGSIADRIGRKKSISLWSFTYTIGAVIEISAMKSYSQIVVGRAVEGIGIGGLSILVPMYQSEYTPKQLRGVIISMYQLFITLGILIASLINLGTKNLTTSASWRITIAVGIVWPLILGIGIQFLDESPRWAMRRGMADKAQHTLHKMYTSEAEVMREMDEMQAAVLAEEMQEPPTFRGIFREPTILRRFLIGMVLQMMQQLTGINYFFYYGTTLFADLHVGDSFVTAVILGTANFLATFGGLWVAKRYGHREALIYGSIWIGTWLMLYAFLGHYCVQHTCTLSSTATGSLMVLFTCLSITGFATTWGPLAWVVCAEIFPPRWKAVGMGAATATNWTFNFLIGFLTKSITARIGYGLGWVFAGGILVGAWFVFVFVHETQGKSLEEIDREILEGNPAWKSRKGL